MTQHLHLEFGTINADFKNIKKINYEKIIVNYGNACAVFYNKLQRYREFGFGCVAAF